MLLGRNAGKATGAGEGRHKNAKGRGATEEITKGKGRKRKGTADEVEGGVMTLRKEGGEAGGIEEGIGQEERKSKRVRGATKEGEEEQMTEEEKGE